MAVFIDNMNRRFGRMIMCHMIADTNEELLEMCDNIKVNKKWIQHPNTYREHFDICVSKKKIAVEKYGAIEISWREYAKKVLSRPGSLRLLVKSIK